MMKKIFTVFLLAFAGMSCLWAQESEKVETHDYATSEGWYVQAQAGANFTAAENTKFVPMNRWTSYNTALSVGKKFTTVWGIRAQVMYGENAGFFESRTRNSAKYTFNHVVGLLEMTMNVTNLFRDVTVGNELPFNVTLMAGPGWAHSFDFDKKGYTGPTSLTDEPQDAFAFYGGVETSYSFNSHFDINLEICGSCQSDNFNGVNYGSYLELAGSVLLGVRYSF